MSRTHRNCLRALVALIVLLFASPTVSAQIAEDKYIAEAGTSTLVDGLDGEDGYSGADQTELPEDQRLSSAIEIVLVLTALSLLPAALISVTSFTRIVIVLSFVRRSLSTNELPPTPIIIGLALFLTSFVMGPVITRVHQEAYVPYSQGEMDSGEALDLAWGELSGFLLANTRPGELALFTEIAGLDEAEIQSAGLPFNVVVPAFVLSELKTAFQMGFLLFLPFLVIDLVIASVLLSMGMFMLPPVMISTPFKILLFVLVDGWHLICHSLVTSFATAA
ncbi:flagellar type III secretion system pore protein FliP [Engelhardtia mirabilis]|uniref:Flagellar biosynthetic protein FliP n=1 Tax=Engelhardtia mirabilis TaxID=2528011 RepID=A0A518BSQ8_9BACT|nr:Flagellar biosynthetic protein FliP precursor [Planctomycetes bacterium Pla133]QDV04333.1 Flagellar biosynthetic protein FliP precursor [Planctomycetes bacterium Pla86]